MNNKTFENASWSFCEGPDDDGVFPNFLGPLRPVVYTYVLHLIVTRGLIASEFYTMNEAIFEFFIFAFDLLGTVALFCPNTCLVTARRFCWGFILVGRANVLTLICTECYLAVLKPWVFLEMKQLKYKVVLSAINWLVTLVSCHGHIKLTTHFQIALALYMILCFVTKLYCCVAILVALKHPGPGDGFKQQKGMNKQKLKAFKIVSAITTSVIFLYVPFILLSFSTSFWEYKPPMIMWDICYSTAILSECISLYFFFQRTGKLPCVRKS